MAPRRKSPAKRRDLSDEKPGECRDNYNSAAWLGQSLDKSKRIKRALAWQLSRAMQAQQKTKRAMAKQLPTSQSQLDRLLDPQNASGTHANLAPGMLMVVVSYA
jgi:hypothetical protein